MAVGVKRDSHDVASEPRDPMLGLPDPLLVLEELVEPMARCSPTKAFEVLRLCPVASHRQKLWEGVIRGSEDESIAALAVEEVSRNRRPWEASTGMRLLTDACLAAGLAGPAATCLHLMASDPRWPAPSWVQSAELRLAELTGDRELVRQALATHVALDGRQHGPSLSRAMEAAERFGLFGELLGLVRGRADFLISRDRVDLARWLCLRFSWHLLGGDLVRRLPDWI